MTDDGAPTRPDIATLDTQIAPATPTAPRRLSLASYEVGEVLGRGGMGEVVAAHDPNLGRDVAIKRMRADAPPPELVERFLREARIQARLDHPAIVPVHELGRDAAGQPYFTMKRLAGTTMQDVLATAPQSRLLRAFIDVCLAIEFAHARGIVHRDLKPSNIVLGDYGEVYVLDWGVARVLHDADARGTELPSEAGATLAGALLGTPGYMAPEQARGAPDVGPAADTYALGAILFEILAGAPLHGRESPLADTLTNPQASPVARHPDRAIPPELDAACTGALADDASARPSARALGERVQRYLDGDRDLERRRVLAAEQLAKATVATSRVDAIRLAGRAMALDPESAGAAELVARMLLEPPKTLPHDVEQELAVGDVAVMKLTGRGLSAAVLMLVAFVPLFAWAGVVEPLGLALLVAYTVVVAFVVRFVARSGDPLSLVPIALTVIMMAAMSRIVGSFVVLPGVVAIGTTTLCAHPRFVDRPLVVIAIGVLTVFVPVALEAAGVLGPTYGFDADALVVHSRLFHLGGASAYVLLFASTIAMIVVQVLFGQALVRTRRAAIQQLALQAWHLRQLLPATSLSP